MASVVGVSAFQMEPVGKLSASWKETTLVNMSPTGSHASVLMIVRQQKSSGYTQLLVGFRETIICVDNLTYIHIVE